MRSAESETLTARRLLWLALGQPGGYHVLERTVCGEFVRSFARAAGHESPGWCVGFFLRALNADDCFLSAVPHRERNGWPGQAAGVLWVPVESGAQREALRFFKPRPSVLLQAGDSVRQWAVWALARPLSAKWTENLNRRIAHRLKAPKKLSGMDAMLPAPGTVLRHGRESRPLLVRVVECREEFHSARAVAGWLPEAPDPDAWREAV